MALEGFICRPPLKEGTCDFPRKGQGRQRVSNRQETEVDSLHTCLFFLLHSSWPLWLNSIWSQWKPLAQVAQGLKQGSQAFFPEYKVVAGERWKSTRHAGVPAGREEGGFALLLRMNIASQCCPTASLFSISGKAVSYYEVCHGDIAYGC